MSTAFVSILILLEVILEEETEETVFNTILCFNPYFTGSNSGSYQIVIQMLKRSGFNPYFTGSNSGSSLFRSHHHQNRKFQSLFYWK